MIDREPTMAERLKYARMAEVTHDRGYPSTRTAMDLPVSQALMRAVDEGAGEPAVKLPLLGGSVPMYIFADLGLPVIGVPIANFDDHQHSPTKIYALAISGAEWKSMPAFWPLSSGKRDYSARFFLSRWKPSVEPPHSLC